MKSARPISTGAPESAAGATWREAPEGGAALLWGLSAVASLVVCLGFGETAAGLPAALAAVMALRRLHAARTVLAARARLAGCALEFIPRPVFAENHREAAQAGVVWFGKGFDWTPEHAQKLYELTKIDAARLIPPAWLLKCVFLEPRPGKDPGAIGLAALHGVGEKDIDLTVTEKTLEGGTLLVGTTQAGKGVMLNVLITQAVLKGDPVIVLDPKNSSRLRGAVTAAAALAGRDDPLILDPTHAAMSVRLNPLASYGRPSELAGRITAAITEEGPFKAFAWSAVHAAASLMDWLERQPSLAAVKDVMQSGIGTLLQEALDKEGQARGDSTYQVWREVIDAKKLPQRESLLLFLEQREAAKITNPVIDAAAAVYRHDPAHYAKITASLMPILEMLTSGPLLATLSPDTKDKDDTRTYTTLKGVIENNSILYVALDALPDPQLAGTVGSILLSDLASLAGERYRESAAPSRVALFVDECSNVINRPLIELLNKGAESGIRTTCAMQTVSDLAARLGSDAEARMALGNFNNLIALRTKDRATQEFVAESFGKTYIAATEAALTTSSHTGPAAAFAAGVTRRMTSTRDDIIPTDVLGKLSNAEFFASLAGGRLVKGRIPILIDDKPEVPKEAPKEDPQ